MADRYDEGVRALRDVPVPDQWDEIAARAARKPPVTAPVEANGSGPGRTGRRWPLLMAAAAAGLFVVIGAAVAFTREDPDVRTGSDRPTTTDDETEPSTTTSTTAMTSTTDTTATTATSSTAPSNTTNPGTGALPHELVDLENYPVSACRGLQFTATTPPSGVEGTMQPAQFDDPRVPPAVHGNLTGVFPSTTTTRAVFVVAGWPGLNDDSGSFVAGPFPGVQSWISPYDDGWLAEMAAPASAETYCPVTLIGLGLNEVEFRAFLAGLTLEG